MYNKLSNQDKEMIFDYIRLYGGDGYLEDPSKIHLEQVLNEWSRKKGDLCKLLGDQLIYKTEVSFEEGPDEIASKMYDDQEFMEYLTEVKDAYSDKFLRFNSNREEYDNAYIVFWDLLDVHALAVGRWEKSDLVLTLNGAEVLTLRKGMKLMKAFKTLIQCLGLDEEKFEKFRIAHSMKLNNKKLTGELCLSIHPLDYMTMSDNGSGWSSCMSWQENGCYRSGTVEMMNSPNVVVAYLSSNRDSVDFSDYTWNSKKWRCLFIVDHNVITSVKSYPYYNDTLLMAAGQEIAKLANANWSETGDLYPLDRVQIRQEKELNLSPRHYVNFFAEGNMYCDMGYADSYVGAVSTECPTTESFRVNYSGELTCVYCGHYFGYDSEDVCVCDDCGGAGYRCANCGGHLHEDEIYRDENGDYYCEECYYEEHSYDPYCDDYIPNDDFYELNILFPMKENLGFDVDEEPSWRRDTIYADGEECYYTTIRVSYDMMYDSELFQNVYHVDFAGRCVNWTDVSEQFFKEYIDYYEIEATDNLKNILANRFG